MSPSINVVHDAEHKVMEVLSLYRVMNNYYLKKTKLQHELAPKIKRLRATLSNIERQGDQGDWLLSLPSGLETLSSSMRQKRRDEFRFPNSLVLFEAWMRAGVDALFPRVVINFDFPGIRRGEKVRHVLEFLFSTSRGFGFPITFSPEFYEYNVKRNGFLKALSYPFDWLHTVNRKNNKAIALVGRKYNITRHHPGEFESVIISRFGDNGKSSSGYYGFETVLHGYREKDPLFLGRYKSLEELLENICFDYSIGDHAIKFTRSRKACERTLAVNLITQDELRRRYDIDFQPYLKHVIHLDQVIRKRIEEETASKRAKRAEFPFFTRVKMRLRPKIKKIKPKHLARGYLEEEARVQFLRDLRMDLWNTPLYTHAILEGEEATNGSFGLGGLSHERKDSILLVKTYRFQERWGISYDAIVKDLKKIRDEMARTYFYFKARYLEFAQKTLVEFSRLSRHASNYRETLFRTVDELLPIFTIYEILQRPLSDSAYPEMMLSRQRLLSYVARFFGQKYNPIGVSLMHIHNKLAFSRWSWLIHQKRMTFRSFFEFVGALPIWIHIPKKNGDGTQPKMPGHNPAPNTPEIGVFH
ncbi:MAG: hypothetical protein ACTSU5_15410 [Promethearchaeota archaeon]